MCRSAFQVSLEFLYCVSQLFSQERNVETFLKFFSSFICGSQLFSQERNVETFLKFSRVLYVAVSFSVKREILRHFSSFSGVLYCGSQLFSQERNVETSFSGVL